MSDIIIKFGGIVHIALISLKERMLNIQNDNFSFELPAQSQKLSNILLQECFNEESDSNFSVFCIPDGLDVLKDFDSFF